MNIYFYNFNRLVKVLLGINFCSCFYILLKIIIFEKYLTRSLDLYPIIHFHLIPSFERFIKFKLVYFQKQRLGTNQPNQIDTLYLVLQPFIN